MMNLNRYEDELQILQINSEELKIYFNCLLSVNRNSEKLKIAVDHLLLLNHNNEICYQG